MNECGKSSFASYTFPELTGVGDVATSAAKARISESIDSGRSLQIGCSVEAGDTYMESKEGAGEAPSAVTEDEGAPQGKGKIDQTQQTIVILTAFVAIFQTSDKEPYGSPGELKTY